jgi:hypothetical protein
MRRIYDNFGYIAHGYQFRLAVIFLSEDRPSRAIMHCTDGMLENKPQRDYAIRNQEDGDRNVFGAVGQQG